MKKTLRRVGVRLGVVKAELRDLNDEIQHHAHQALRAHEAADKYEKRKKRQKRKHRPLRARYWEIRENRADARAARRQDRAQAKLPELKARIRIRDNLEDVGDQLRREIKEYEREHGPTLAKVRPDVVEGGSYEQRLRFTALTAADWDRSGKRNSFYSQSGYFMSTRAISGERRGARSDCSQWVISTAHTSGGSDPAGGGFNDGFTGSFVANCHQVSESQLKHVGVGLVVYGYGNGFHVEVYVGPGDDTVGHGSDPVDKGSINMISGYKRFYLFPGTG